MPEPLPQPATLTVDASVRRRMVLDLWLHDLRTLRGAGLVNALLPASFALLLWHTVTGALVVLALVLLGKAAWWWVRLTRNLSKRLPDGQVVSVGHTATGDLVVRDSDEVWLPRGSATAVHRIGSVTLVQGRAVSAVVPTALLTEQDAAFLEGHGDLVPAHPQPATDEPPELPLAVHLTAAIQSDLVAARRGSYLRSGEFAMVVGLPLLAFLLTVFVARPPTTLAVTVALSIPIAFALNGMQRSCAMLKRAYPVGHTLRAGLDADGMVLTMVHGALRVHWSAYQAHRLGSRTLELRTRKGRPLANLTLPLDLFTPEALQVLRTHVPKSF